MNEIKETQLFDKIFIYSDTFPENNQLIDIINDTKNQIWIHNNVEENFNQDNVFEYASCSIGTKVNRNINELSLAERRMYFSFLKLINQYGKTYNFFYTGIVKHHFLKYKKDDFDVLHYDFVGNKDGLSLCYFINDNYEGGELCFPNQELTIKGKSNQLLIFPSTEEFVYYSKPVTSGTKYTSSLTVC